MHCTNCGHEVPDARSCPACGVAIGRTTATVGIDHQRILALLWIVYSTLVFIGAFFANTLLEKGTFRDLPSIIAPLLEGIIAFHIIFAIVGFVLGVTLLTRYRSARSVALVVGAIGLVDLPIGTALGAYTLWVFLARRPAGVPNGMSTLSRPIA
jgi:hypothetical protein